MTKSKRKELWETYSAPAWAWELIWQTIEKECESTKSKKFLLKKANDSVSFEGQGDGPLGSY
jgi:hypothetical protein